LKRDRDALATRLAASPQVTGVRNGGGNFLFLEVDDPAALSARLTQLGIRLRFRPMPHRAECASPSAPRPRMKPPWPPSA
jgi:histidinol-phosphate/aromatic aminotransferase/cobyric acid decarboxylase-like protein